MAHFAKIGIDNEVIGVTPLDTILSMTRQGIESEEVGVEYLKNHLGHESWKQCSYNTRNGVHYDSVTGEPSGKPGFRANYPGVGWYYSSEHDIFYPPKPEGFTSWTLNTVTGQWNAPIEEPQIPWDEEKQGNAAGWELCYYQWDEDLYQSDNTQGWVLVRPDPNAPALPD